MSFIRRPTIGSSNTPNGSRVRQAFKSPFRTTTTNSPSSDKPSHDNSTPKSSKEQSVSVTPKSCEAANDSGDLRSGTTPLDRVTPGRGVNGDKVRRVSGRGFSTPFRSPGTRGTGAALGGREEQLAGLRREELQLDEQIAALQGKGLSVEELKGHIDRLHRYNEMKDAAQVVLGRLAELQGVTVKEMHQKYHITDMD